MSLHHLAKELQKKGRGDDQMLVHMTPKEVQGLQAIAKAHGGSLTVNPDTGLVEAGFLKNIMPMVIGAGLTAATGGAAAPWMIGLGYGGLEAARTGDVGRGLMAGLGAYGGAGLAGMAGLGAAGASGAGGAGAVTPEWTASSTGLNVVPGEAGTVAAAAPTTTPGWAQTSTGLNVLPGEAGTQATQNIAPTMGNAVRYGSTAAAPVLAGAMQPPPVPEQEEYKRKYPELSLTEGFRGFTPERPNPYYTPRGLGYGGYAEGGDVQEYFGGGLAGIRKQVAAQKDGDGEGSAPAAGAFQGFGGMVKRMVDKIRGPQSQSLSLADDFQASIPIRPNPYYVPQGLGYTGYAEGGLTQMAPGGLAALQGMRDGYESTQTADGNIPQFSAGGEPKKKATYTSAAKIASMDPLEAGLAELNNARAMAQMRGNVALPKRSVEDLGVINAAQGRYLKGDGDGMSDSIPATINGRQPARLADGEFVVPADVVSHLGNGSSDAGAKKLYKMMDKVRVARTGKKQQAPAVKTDKYMPA